MPEFSVVIVTYNSQGDILKCIESLNLFSEGYDLEVIVVDNNSVDRTVELLLQINWDVLKVKTNSENLGFSKACNLGAAMATGEYLYFCNPDTIILNDIFSSAKHHLSRKEVGCVSPRILRLDDSEAAFAFSFPHSPGKLLLAFLRDLLGRSNAYILQLNHFTQARVIECDWVLGAALLIRREIFENVGGFDERYFLYFEDIALCRRVKEAGLTILADRTMVIKHRFFGSSKSHLKSEIFAIRIESELAYYRQFHGLLGYWTAKFLDQSGFLFRA